MNLFGGALPDKVVQHIRTVLQPKILKLFPLRYTDDPASVSHGKSRQLPAGYVSTPALASLPPAARL